MQRRRSQSVDAGSLRNKHYECMFASSSRQSLDSTGTRLKFLNIGNKFQVGRQLNDNERGRRASRASIDFGTRRHISYDAWIRAIRVSMLVW